MTENILCAKSELCIFEPISMQVVMESALWCDIHPTTNIDRAQTIEFLISGATTDYLDLNDTILQLTARVTGANGGKPGVKTKESVVTNHLMHALFQDVKVYLNDVQIEGGNSLYPYKAVIQNELNFSDDTKDIQIKCSGYSDNDKDLKKYCSGEDFQLVGALGINFFQTQPKYLIPGVDVKVILERSKHNFCIQLPADEKDAKPLIQIIDATLFVRKVRL